MDAVGCRSFGDYLDFLEGDLDEYEQLFDTLLINADHRAIRRADVREPARACAVRHPARGRAAAARGHGVAAAVQRRRRVRRERGLRGREPLNEELQSTNEELETTNDELRDRTSELNQVNDFLEAILTSLDIGVAVLDRRQRVQVWNRRAEDLWGLRQDEAVDQHVLSLDIGLPVERLAAPLRSVLGGASEREEAVLEAVTGAAARSNARRRSCRWCPRGPSDGQPVRGAIVLMEGGRMSVEE